MNKCKDCQHFKNDCEFSNVDELLGLNGDFVACGQFVKSKIQKDCLAEKNPPTLVLNELSASFLCSFHRL